MLASWAQPGSRTAGMLHGFPGLWIALLWVASLCSFLALSSLLSVRTGIVLLNQQPAGSTPVTASQQVANAPDPYAGPTRTGQAPFLAATNPAPFAGVPYIPNQPLETQVPIVGNKNSENVFQKMGHLSHYFPNPQGFGVDEYSLPPGANITMLNMLHRHGARYPTSESGVYTLADKLKNTSGHWKASGELSFLNDWQFMLGAEILVPIGKQELFDSGTLHYYQYGHLYPNDGSKIVARTTTQHRMTESAEYFLAGFFGLGWTRNVTLERIIEHHHFNNSLSGYDNCNNSNADLGATGSKASEEWQGIYLKDATNRLQTMISGFEWTVKDTYNAQTMCAYETVALGYSSWCGLFTYEEWEGFEYSIDIEFAGNAMFQSPTGRAVGIGYVQEYLARLEKRLITKPTAQVNVTLDSSTKTFPLDQSLYFDFSHDTNIAAILTAFGLTQFAPVLPATQIPANRSLIVSHVTPFAARLDIEIIRTPSPLSPNRSDGPKYVKGEETEYVRFALNQRTIPLHASLKDCEERDDGWCELEAFMDSQSKSLENARYEYSCFGKYGLVPYGDITDGVPIN